MHRLNVDSRLDWPKRRYTNALTDKVDWQIYSWIYGWARQTNLRTNLTDVRCAIDTMLPIICDDIVHYSQRLHLFFATTSSIIRNDIIYYSFNVMFHYSLRHFHYSRRYRSLSPNSIAHCSQMTSSIIPSDIVMIPLRIMDDAVVRDR